MTSIEHGVFVPPERRRMGMVFQSYAIWPHMTVFDNVAYPCGPAVSPFSEVAPRVGEAHRLVQLEGYERATPHSFRAPAATRGPCPRPGCSILLCAAARRAALQPRCPAPRGNAVQIRELQQRLKITTVYVTHDQSEALWLSDIVAVMHAGKIVQLGPPREIYETPANQFVASFVGSTNFIRGRASSQDGLVETSVGVLRCRLPSGTRADDELLFSIRPSAAAIRIEPPHDASNVITAAACTRRSTLANGLTARWTVAESCCVPHRPGRRAEARPGRLPDGRARSLHRLTTER